MMREPVVGCGRRTEHLILRSNAFAAAALSDELRGVAVAAFRLRVLRSCIDHSIYARSHGREEL